MRALLLMPHKTPTTPTAPQQGKRQIPPQGSYFPKGDGDPREDETPKIGEQDYSEKKKAGTFRRTELTRDILSKGMACLLILAFASVALMVLSLVLHYVLPYKETGCCNWLSEDQLGDMKSLLFSGAVAGAVAGFVQRHTG